MDPVAYSIGLLLGFIIGMVVLYYVLKHAIKNGINESVLGEGSSNDKTPGKAPIDPSKLKMADRVAHALKE